MTGKSTVCVLAVSCVVVASVQIPTRGQERKEKARVSVEDIRKSVDLVGRLGVPLGEMMTIEGKWTYPPSRQEGTMRAVAKSGSIRFTVTSVNEKRLSEPVEFDVAQIHAMHKGGKDAISSDLQHHRQLLGLSWKLRCYEWGRFDGKPAGWWDESGEPPYTSPYYLKAFTTYLEGVLVSSDGVPK